MAKHSKSGNAAHEGAETPASMMAVKQIIRSKLRHQDEHEHTELNIYAMMDMMTILLVFLIMQFANSAAAILQESADLKIPFSTSTMAPDEALPIQISRNEIAVDGQKILELREGQIDPANKQGGGTGFLVTPLFKKLQKEAERRKLIAQKNTQRPFKGQVLIVADKRTPFRTLSEVLYTMGQAEFSSMSFVVSKAGAN